MSLLFLVVYTANKEIYPLFAMDEKGGFSTSWKLLPPSVQERLGEAFKEALPPNAKSKMIPKMADEFPGE